MKVGLLASNPMNGILGYGIRQSELTKHLSQLGSKSCGRVNVLTGFLL